MGAKSGSTEEQATGEAREATRTKEASALVYLVEELGDARMRCDQLLRYVDRATKLIEKSSHKDHFFEVAGDLIRAIPETSFKLQKALQAVALAANRIDYEEIKQDLRPEKAEELERVLKDVRVRQVQRRSLPMVNPATVVEQLRGLAKQARSEGQLDTEGLATLIASLENGLPRVAENPGTKAAAQLDAMAHALEHPPEGQLPSAVRLAKALRRTLGDQLNVSVEARRKMPRFQVGDIVQSDLDQPGPHHAGKGEITELHETYDRTGWLSVKWADRPEPARDSAWGLKLVRRKRKSAGDVMQAAHEHGAEHIDLTAGKKLEGDAALEFQTALLGVREILAGRGNPKRKLFSVLASLAKGCAHLNQDDLHDIVWKAAMAVNSRWSAADAAEYQKQAATSNEDKRSRYEEGKPADPTEHMSEEDAKAWKDNTDEHKDKFKKDAKGDLTNIMLPPSGLPEFRPAEAAASVEGAIYSLKMLHKQLSSTSHVRAGGISHAFKEVISDLGAAAWNLNLPALSSLLEKAKLTVRLKAAGDEVDDDGVVEKEASAEAPEPLDVEVLEATLDTFLADAKFVRTFGRAGNYKKMFFNIMKTLADVHGICESFGVPGVDVLQRVTMKLHPYASSKPAMKFGADEDKRSRYEEGKPADPTENMSEEDAKAWKDNTDEHKDKFKSADSKEAFGYNGRLYVEYTKGGHSRREGPFDANVAKRRLVALLEDGSISHVEIERREKHAAGREAARQTKIDPKLVKDLTKILMEDGTPRSRAEDTAEDYARKGITPQQLRKNLADHEKRILDEMGDLLKSHGYDPKDAKKIREEDGGPIKMGPHELEERLKHPEALERDFKLKKKSASAEDWKAA